MRPRFWGTSPVSPSVSEQMFPVLHRATDYAHLMGGLSAPHPFAQGQNHHDAANGVAVLRLLNHPLKPSAHRSGNTSYKPCHSDDLFWNRNKIEYLCRSRNITRVPSYCSGFRNTHLCATRRLLPSGWESRLRSGDPATLSIESGASVWQQRGSSEDREIVGRKPSG